MLLKFSEAEPWLTWPRVIHCPNATVGPTRLATFLSAQPERNLCVAHHQNRPGHAPRAQRFD